MQGMHQTTLRNEEDDVRMKPRVRRTIRHDEK